MIRFISLQNYPQYEQVQIVQPPKPVAVPELEAVDPPKKKRKPCRRNLYDPDSLRRMRAAGMGYIQIGRLYDKHHTTILYACRKWGIK